MLWETKIFHGRVRDALHLRKSCVAWDQRSWFKARHYTTRRGIGRAS